MGDNWETQKHMSNESRHQMAKGASKGKGYLSTMPTQKYRPALVRVDNTKPDMTRGTKAQSSINSHRGPSSK